MPPPAFRLSMAGVLRAGWRGTFIFLVIFLGVMASVGLRLIERPFYGLHRPWSPYVTQWVSAAVFRVLGMRHEVVGTSMRAAGAVVANHSSWMDIFALNARKRVYFVSKSEVAKWPGIGGLAKLVGTVFITRDPKEAKAQTEIFEARLLAGHKLLFFPEGSSTDGMRVLPFKSTLFQAFFSKKLQHEIHIQPVSVIYEAPNGQDPRFYGWWGDMEFGEHLLRVLAVRRNGKVRVVYHPYVKVDEFESRKVLAAWAEDRVRAGMPEDRRGR
ncbi:1-acyl-sn-glycerol-3-phosphate acyltransferase [Roseovarius sp. MBR-51]